MEQRIITDPRPDLKDDTKCWEKLFNLPAIRRDYETIWVLHGFRCQGTLLIRHKDTYVLRPKLGEDGWKSKEEYIEQRNKYLVPRRNGVARALKLLAEAEEGKQNAG